MKYWFILILFLGICREVFSQDERSIQSLKEEANKYYEEEQYNLAIQYYRELTDQNIKDAEVSYRLADCYLKTLTIRKRKRTILRCTFLPQSSILYRSITMP